MILKGKLTWKQALPLTNSPCLLIQQILLTHCYFLMQLLMATKSSLVIVKKEHAVRLTSAHLGHSPASYVPQLRHSTRLLFYQNLSAARRLFSFSITPESMRVSKAIPRRHRRMVYIIIYSTQPEVVCSIETWVQRLSLVYCAFNVYTAVFCYSQLFPKFRLFHSSWCSLSA